YPLTTVSLRFGTPVTHVCAFVLLRLNLGLRRTSANSHSFVHHLNNLPTSCNLISSICCPPLSTLPQPAPQPGNTLAGYATLSPSAIALVDDVLDATPAGNSLLSLLSPPFPLGRRHPAPLFISFCLDVAGLSACAAISGLVMIPTRGVPF